MMNGQQQQQQPFLQPFNINVIVLPLCRPSLTLGLTTDLANFTVTILQSYS
jgi:hypothetical protein